MLLLSGRLNLAEALIFFFLLSKDVNSLENGEKKFWL
jgi:hypothetical protein